LVVIVCGISGYGKISHYQKEEEEEEEEE